MLGSAATAAAPSRSWTVPALSQSVSAAKVAASYGTVTSIYRTTEHNRAVGGVPNSFHLAGRAIDVARRPGVTHFEVAAGLRKAGFDFVESIDEGDHSHFAFSLPGSTSQTARAKLAPPPEMPKPKLVAADDHGELLVDLGPKPVMIGASVPQPATGSSKRGGR